LRRSLSGKGKIAEGYKFILLVKNLFFREKSPQISAILLTQRIGQVRKEVEALEKEGKVVEKCSFFGYSLGGLISRYAIGALGESGFFDKHEPIVSQMFVPQALALYLYGLLIGYLLEFYNLCNPACWSTTTTAQYISADLQLVE
jgi:Putative serine esterase (DUF676)